MVWGRRKKKKEEKEKKKEEQQWMNVSSPTCFSLSLWD